MALHDEAAVLPMSLDVDRPRLMSEVSANLDRVIGEFDALALEPAMRDMSPEVGEVQRSLGNLRGSLQAQVEARGVEPELLRVRLADLDGSLQRFQQRLSQTTP